VWPAFFYPGLIPILPSATAYTRAPAVKFANITCPLQEERMAPRPFMLSSFLFVTNVTIYLPGALHAQDASWADKLCDKAPSLCEGLPPDMIQWAPAQSDAGQFIDMGTNARVKGIQTKIRAKSVRYHIRVGRR